MSGKFDQNLARFKARISGFATKLRAGGGSFHLMNRFRRFDPSKAMDGVTGIFQRQDASFYGRILTIVLCSYFLANISGILVGKLLPEAPLRTHFEYGARHGFALDDYNVIFARNLFNSKGIIPGENVGTPTGGVQDNGGVPVKSSLPLQLIGTMIMDNEMRSIATIQDKNSQKVYPVRVQDEVPTMAKILKIEPRRVTFVNLENHNREYIELPENIEIKAPRITLGHAGGGIQQVGAHQFDISRDEITQAMSNLNNILTQARAVPNFENGQPAGYKLFQIVPGSIYTKLGLQDGDVICGFDGQPANDPAAAFQKLSNLQNTSHLDLCVKRGGQQSTFSYDFK